MAVLDMNDTASLLSNSAINVHARGYGFADNHASSKGFIALADGRWYVHLPAFCSLSSTC